MERGFGMDFGINKSFNTLENDQLQNILGGNRDDYDAGHAYGRMVGVSVKWGWFIATHL